MSFGLGTFALVFGGALLASRASADDLKLRWRRGFLLLPLGLGYLWMLWDRRRQTWQDKLGGTLVVRDPPPASGSPAPPPSTVPPG